MAEIDVAAAIFTHTVALPREAGSPLRHYERKANDASNLLAYVQRNLARVRTYPAPREKHLHLLCRMVLLDLVQAFERFLKETASLYIDEVAPLIADDRFAELKIQGDRLAAHFAEGSVGKALSESDTWLDCDSINKRFKRVLQDHFRKDTKFDLFPTEQQDRVEGFRSTVLNVVFQLRHTIVHNAGVMTRSDAAKLRLLLRRPIDAPKVLWPERDDVSFIKQFLDDQAVWVTTRVADRLGTLLTELLARDPTLFDASAKAQHLADGFQASVRIHDTAASPASFGS